MILRMRTHFFTGTRKRVHQQGRFVGILDPEPSPSPSHANFHRKRKHQEIVEDIDSIIRSPAEVGLAGWVRTAIAQCPSLFLLVSC